MLFWALIVICAVDAPVCDMDHKIYAEKSEPEFPSELTCRAAALAHVQAMWGHIPGVKPGDEYQVTINCQPGEPGCDA